MVIRGYVPSQIGGSGPVGIFMPLIRDFEPGSEAFPSCTELPEASVISKLHHRPAFNPIANVILNLDPLIALPVGMFATLHAGLIVLI